MQISTTWMKAMTAVLAFSAVTEMKAIIADPPKPSVVFEEDFSLIPAIEPWQGKRYGIFNQDETLKDEYFHVPGWKGWYISYGKDAGVAHFEFDSDSDTGYIQTPPINLTADEGKVTITVEYRRDSWANQITTNDNIHIQLRDRANGMDKGITGIYSKEGNAEVNTEWGTYTVTLQGGTADCSIRIWGGSYPGDLRNIKVLQVLPEIMVPVADKFSDFTGETFTANWREVEGADAYLLSVFALDGENRDYHIKDEVVTGTSYTVTGLDPMKIYHYSVKTRKGDRVSEESNVVKCLGIPTPLAPEISDVSENGFNVSWQAPYNANIYQLETTLVHKAPADERYCLLDDDFLNTPNQNLDPDNAKREDVTYLDDYLNRANYTVRYPLFAQDCIALDNTFASMGGYGELDGPTMDLSADGGKVTVEMRVRALNAASMGLYMLNAVDRVNEFTSDKVVDRIELWDNSMLEPLTEAWADRTFTLTGGNEKSYIAIQAYGYGSVVQIDRLAIYQNLKEGETIRVPYRSNVTSDTNVRVNTNGEGFNDRNDHFECSLMGANLSDDGDETVYSNWSEPSSVTLPRKESVIANATVSGSVMVMASGSQIAVSNPDRLPVTVHSLSGAVVYSSAAESFTTAELASGIYFISAPGMKTVKIAL